MIWLLLRIEAKTWEWRGWDLDGATLLGKMELSAYCSWGREKDQRWWETDWVQPGDSKDHDLSQP